MYAGAPLSLGAFRRQMPEADRPYRMQAAWFLAPAAFVVADLLIYWSGFEVIWKLGIVLMHRVRADRHTRWRSTRSGRRWTGSRRCGCRPG